jgi:hypothetical protein
MNETPGKLSTAPTTNVTFGSPLPSIRSGSDSVGLPASRLATSLASFLACRRSWNGWSRPVASTQAIATASAPIHRADRLLGGARRARAAQREDDHETERDAGRVRAEQIAHHQPPRAWEQQHHGHGREQRRVEHRDQRQQEYVDQVARWGGVGPVQRLRPEPRRVVCPRLWSRRRGWDTRLYAKRRLWVSTLPPLILTYSPQRGGINGYRTRPNDCPRLQAARFPR